MAMITAMIQYLSESQKAPYPEHLQPSWPEGFQPFSPVTWRSIHNYHHLEFSSPQMPVQDNEMKAGIFPGKAIIVEAGK